MTQFGTEPSFHAYLQILRHRRWWVGSITVLGLVVSLAFSLTAHKQYSSTAQLLIQSSINASALGAVQQPVTQTDVETELQLVTSAPVQQAVRHKLNSAPAVSASQVGQTNVIAITATSQLPSRASLIANLYANAFVQYCQAVESRSLATTEAQLLSQISSLSQQLKSFGGKYTSPEAAALLNQEAVLKEQLAQTEVSSAVDMSAVVLVTPAQTPASPSSPKPVQDSLLGLVAGLVLGLCAAFVRESLDDRLISKEATEHAGGAPVLAMTPLVSSRGRQQPLVIAVAEPTSAAAESYRSLRTSLQFARQGQRLRSVLVTSPGPGEGKTSIMANLGVVFAQAGERVVLVSGDLRRPMIAEFFGLSEEVGLTSVLLGERTLIQAMLPVPGFEGLTLLPAGPLPSNPTEMLSSPDAENMFAQLRDRFDLVLIDSPPVLPVTDASILSRYADATLMLVAASQTRRADLHRAAERLNQVGGAILGIVLNKATRQTGRYYGYTYSYAAYPTESAAAGRHAHLNGSGKVRGPMVR